MMLKRMNWCLLKQGAGFYRSQRPVEALAWLKKKYEGHENIQENVGHDKLTKRSLHVPTGTFTSSMGSLSMKVTDEVDSRDFEGESDSDEDDSDNYSLDSSSSFHDAMTNDILYLQDSSSWVLPDVTSQLTKLNNGRDMLYTRKFGGVGQRQFYRIENSLLLWQFVMLNNV